MVLYKFPYVDQVGSNLAHRGHVTRIILHKLVLLCDSRDVITTITAVDDTLTVKHTLHVEVKLVCGSQV